MKIPAFYALSGVASEKEEGSSVSGDNFSLFSMENGHYHVCVSDGMGSGNRLHSGKSDMVVELMQKFMEAGFPQETAIRMMNSAMVLQGDRESYSTLDFYGSGSVQWADDDYQNRCSSIFF